MPFSSEPGECALCLQLQDTAVHVFAKCSITRQIWTILNKVLSNIIETSFPLDNLTPLNFHVPIKFEIFTETIALILTVTNYCIWQTRKKQLDFDYQKLAKVKPSNVLARIFNHIKIQEKKRKFKNRSNKLRNYKKHQDSNWQRTTQLIWIESILFRETILSALVCFSFFRVCDLRCNWLVFFFFFPNFSSFM